MTDIISFNVRVSNENLALIIAKILSSNQLLRILYGTNGKFNNKQCIKIVGQTDIGTTYEIIIVYS
jgi:flagellar biogenesis protein FliO